MKKELKELLKVLKAADIDAHTANDDNDNEVLVIEWDHGIYDKIDTIEKSLSSSNKEVFKDIDYINDIIEYYTTDEVIHCDCGRVAYTQDYYNEHYKIINDTVYCNYCIEHDPDFKDVLYDYLLNNYKAANTDDILTEDYMIDKGFILDDNNGHNYYNGLHNFTQTAPEELHNNLIDKYDIVFTIVHKDVYGLEYNVYKRLKGDHNE